jgi:hypothetical protein
MFDTAFVNCNTGSSNQRLAQVETILLRSERNREAREQQFERHQRDIQQRVGNAFEVVGKLGKKIVEIQDEIRENVGQVRSQVSDVQEVQEETKEEVVQVRSQVSDVQSDLKGLREDLSTLRREVASTEDTRQQFMRVLHTLFNGATGVIGMCPVGFRDVDNVFHKLVVVSMPIMVWYFKKAKTGVKLTELAIRAFFASGNPLQLAPEFVYSDFIKIMLRTPFKIRAIGTRGNRNDRANRNEFIILDGETARVKLAEAKGMYNLTSTELALETVRRPHSHGHDGQRIAFTLGSKNSKNSGKIQIYGNKIFTMDEMARIPAMGIPLTVEMYDLPYVLEFFGLTKATANGRHIVGGEVALDLAEVQTHQQAFEGRREEMEAILTSKKKRKRSR